jgi:hypothetical protein
MCFFELYEFTAKEGVPLQNPENSENSKKALNTTVFNRVQIWSVQDRTYEHHKD